MNGPSTQHASKKQQPTTTFGRAVRQCSEFVTRLNMCVMLQMKQEQKKMYFHIFHNQCVIECFSLQGGSLALRQVTEKHKNTSGTAQPKCNEQPKVGVFEETKHLHAKKGKHKK